MSNSLKSIKDMKNIAKAVKKTALFWEAPKTGNLVCYQRARNLKLFGKKGVRFGIKNPKTGRLISLGMALGQKILSKSQLKHAA
jgi:hypothetical protein